MAAIMAQAGQEADGRERGIWSSQLLSPVVARGSREDPRCARALGEGRSWLRSHADGDEDDSCPALEGNCSWSQKRAKRP